MSGFSLTYSNTGLRLVEPSIFGINVSILELPAGLVRTGRINNPNTFAETVKQAMAQATPHPIKSATVRVGLPEEQAFVKLLQLPPKLTKSELRGAVDYQWQNVLPISQDQVFYDCCYIEPVNGKKKSKDGLKTEPQPVLIVAYPKDIVTSLLAVFHQLNLTPELFLPESFGVAKLYSPKSGEPVITLHTLDGQDVQASIIKDSLTLFSTTLHMNVDDTRIAKQVQNIKEFYLRSTNGSVGEVTQVVIAPNPYSGNLGQTLQTAGVTSSILSHPKLLNRVDTTIAPSLLGITGLSSRAFGMSILPPELADERLVKKQLTTFRSLLVILFTILSLMTYFSFIFYVSLKSNNLSRVAYSQTVLDRLTSESKELGTKTSELNLLIDRLAPLKTKRSHLTPLISALYAQAAPNSISLTKIGFADGKSIIVDASAQDQTRVTTFIEAIKQDPKIANMKQELISPTATTTGIPFRLTITTKPQL